MAKNMTIEELAGMTKRGFDDLQKTVATKDDLRDSQGADSPRHRRP